LDFVKNVHFKKYVFMDATASVLLYQKIFGERLKVVDLTLVKNRGRILQYTKLSCSKSGLEQYGEELVKQLDGNPILTFKGIELPNVVTKHYHHNLAGTNDYAGQNINVVGTPRYPTDYYEALNAALDLGIVDFTMSMQTVRYDGREFDFYTYKDPTLQRIELETIEGMLIQAVHRARLIRHECTVKLYSNFPLQQAEYIY
jgi:hypothetical protein